MGAIQMRSSAWRMGAWPQWRTKPPANLLEALAGDAALRASMASRRSLMRLNESLPGERARSARPTTARAPARSVTSRQREPAIGAVGPIVPLFADAA